MKQIDLVVIGGGPAGLAAAIAARKNGVEKILILERDSFLGGILNQCVHTGFGLHHFGEELTGPEYADRFIHGVEEEQIPYLLDATVLSVSPKLVVNYIGKRYGLCQLQAKAILLAMGCRERPRGALNIPGYRPAGIYTAGSAQRLVNIEGLLPGRKVVILGSGDIGLIMARRMVLEGAEVMLASELMPYSGGLARNITQCLDDYDIPLRLSHTAINIHGRKRMEGVTLAEVDAAHRPISGTEEYVPCDSLLLSVGLAPENELSISMGLAMDDATGGPFVAEDYSTSLPGVFICGNVLHVHDLVDSVSDEAERAGKSAAAYLAHGATEEHPSIRLRTEQGIRYVVPQILRRKSAPEKIVVQFRVSEPAKECAVALYCGERCLSRAKFPGLSPGRQEQMILLRNTIPEDAQEIVIRTE